MTNRNVASRPAHGSSQAGFTLVEALVAIVILAFGLIAITNLFLVAASSNTVGNATTTAAAQASERLETLKAIEFNTLAVGGDTDGNPATNPTFADVRNVQGVGQIITEWQVVNVGVGDRFIRVRSEAQGGLTGARSRAEFTTFRTCASDLQCCPVPAPLALGQACACNMQCGSNNCPLAPLPRVCAP